MKKYAILLGSSPEDFRQKKIEDMFDFLDSKRNKGDSVVTFANGISELMLEMVLDNSVKQLAKARHCETKSLRHCERSEAISETGDRDCFVANAPRNDANCHSELDSESNDEMLNQVQHDSLLLYICTLRPVGDDEKSVWLGGEEIRCDVISHYQELARDYGIDMQVVFDSDSELLNEEELGWEDVVTTPRSVRKRATGSTTTHKVCHCEASAEAISETVNEDCFVTNISYNDGKNSGER